MDAAFKMYNMMRNGNRNGNDEKWKWDEKWK